MTFFKDKRILLLCILLIALVGFSLVPTLSKYSYAMNKNTGATVAKWEVYLDTSDNTSDEISLVSGNGSQTYILELTSTSETIATYSIVLSNLPDGLKVKLDDGTYKTPIDSEISWIDVGYINANATERTIIHRLTFEVPLDSDMVGLNEINVDVTFVQKRPEISAKMINGKAFNELIPPDTTEIYFVDTPAPAGAEVIDVSDSSNGSVVMWQEDNEVLYVSSQVPGKVIYGNEDSSYMFSTYYYQDSSEVINLIDLENFDTSKVTNMEYMFASSFNLENIGGLEHFDTSHVTTMEGMFEENNVLNSLVVSSFDTSNVTNMSRMFLGVNEITELDVTNFDTSHVTNMSEMFVNLMAIYELDLSSFDTSNVTDMSRMFAENNNFETIYASDNFVVSSVTNSEDMFLYCESLVGGQNTTFDGSHLDASYAHIDGGPTNPGYFSRK